MNHKQHRAPQGRTVARSSGTGKKIAIAGGAMFIAHHGWEMILFHAFEKLGGHVGMTVAVVVSGVGLVLVLRSNGGGA